jgi:WD40 repeat protein
MVELSRKCPRCGSSETRFRVKRNDWFCDACDHSWEAAPPAPRDESVVPLKIFLSYGHDQHAADALQIKGDLEQRGHSVWFDLERLHEGRDWEQYIEEGLKACDKVVLLMTPYSVRRRNPRDPDSRDGYCLNEIAKAIERNKLIIPVLLVELEEGPPTSICRIQYLDLRDAIPIKQNKKHYERRFERLVKAVEHDALDSEGGQQRLLKQLRPLDFGESISRHIARFRGRTWLFDRLNDWLEHSPESRVFWIVGGPGIGKSAIAAWLCHHRPDVIASHFCVHGHNDKADPRRAVMSLAYQIASHLAEYERKLQDLLLEEEQAKNAKTLFDNLVVAPLRDVTKPKDHQLVVIDGIDEATRDGQNEIAEFVANNWSQTPGWLRLVITSRPESEVIARLTRPDLKPFVLDAQSQENLDDLTDYLRAELAKLELGADEQILRAILGKSEGMFLYVTTILEEILQGNLSLDRLNEFPKGMSGHYRASFSRRFPNQVDYEHRILPLLGTIIAQRGPLPLDLLAATAGLTEFELRKRLQSLGSMFPIRTSHEGARRIETVSPFHKSITDWLMAHAPTGGFIADDYAVDVQAGRQQLANVCWQDYQQHRTARQMSPYTVAHLPHHLIATQRWDELETILTDLSYLESKTWAGLAFDLAGDFTAAVEALPADRPQRRILRLLEEALRRDIHFIARHATNYPQALFQCLWNSCWWYDCPDASAHYVRSAGLHRDACLPWERTGAKLHELLEVWRHERLQIPSCGVWLRSLRPPANSLDAGLCTSFHGHNGAVTAVAYSSDALRIASASDDGTVCLWDATSGKLWQCLHGSGQGMTSVAFSPNGDVVAAGSLDGSVRIWSARSGQELQELRGHSGTVYCVAFSADTHRIASGASDGVVRIWDWATGQELACLTGHISMVRSIVFLGSNQVASGSYDGTIRIWDARRDREPRSLGGDLGPVYGLCYSPVIQRLASGSGDGSLRLWNADTGDETHRFYSQHGAVRAVAFSPDSEFVAGGCYDGLIDIWDIGDQKIRNTFSAHDGWVSSVAFSPGGDRVASASHAIYTWNVDSIQPATLRGHTRWIKSISRSLDGQRFVTGSDDATIWTWDARTGAGAASVRTAADDTGFSAVACSPSGEHIAGASWVEMTVRIWEVVSGHESRTLRGHQSVIRTLAYSPDSKLLATGSNDKTVRLWDAQEGTEKRCLKDHLDAVLTVAFSSDSKCLAAGSLDGVVCVWDVESSTRMTRIVVPGGAVRSVGFSQDGERIGTYSDDHKTRVWESATGRCLEVLVGGGDTGAIAASPDVFPFRALGGSIETLVTDAVTGKEIARFPLPLWYINTSPSGKIWAGAFGEYLALVALEDDS